MGGILAVPKGQIEAKKLTRYEKDQLPFEQFFLPQALRVMMPPLGNQYLNLTKNTSLAIAVGFSDLVQVGQKVLEKPDRKEPSVFAIWMLFYLACFFNYFRSSKFLQCAAQDRGALTWMK
ncbi:MAG: hypothetical protein Ct9H90mP5_08830 [Acidimicrobiaceae bacterium]|nr:MAG: hypothetical protein Ct9H90mP5_08830 [Acidimicrobiaceae bacterium]